MDADNKKINRSFSFMSAPGLTALGLAHMYYTIVQYFYFPFLSPVITSMQYKIKSETNGIIRMYFPRQIALLSRYNDLKLKASKKVKGGQWVQIKTFSLCVEMIFKQFQTIKFFHVQLFKGQKNIFQKVCKKWSSICDLCTNNFQCLLEYSSFLNLPG